MGEVAMPAKVTMVVVSGTLESGPTISQTIPVPHQDGVTDAQIISAAFANFKGIGGIVTDTPGGGMDFYMASKFVPPFRFEIQKVLVAGADALNGLKRNAQLIS